eukprot:3364554-Ditylum_brightwellii.AAC.1
MVMPSKHDQITLMTFVRSTQYGYVSHVYSKQRGHHGDKHDGDGDRHDSDSDSNKHDSDGHGGDGSHFTPHSLRH